MLDLTSDILVKPVKIFTEYNGVYIENFVSQELTACGNKELYYWTSRSDAEVDFILQDQNRIYPVEVKSGMSRNLRSLRSYEARYSPESIQPLPK